MQYGITKSVGSKGANESNDVRFIQTCLNANRGKLKSPFKELGVDGLCYDKTISAIKTFQKECVLMQNPDGRVDPGGKTIQFLTMHLSKRSDNSGKVTAAPVAAPIESTVGLQKFDVKFAKGIDGSLVSLYALDVIRLALKRCDMSQAVISSTLRTPESQARAMLVNARKDYPAQVRLYGSSPGQKVIQVFAEHKSKSDSVVEALMIEKIREIQKDGVAVSRHCVSVETYKKRNAIDIGVNSTQTGCKNYNAQKFTKALESLEAEGYIAKFLDERGKNGCWHIEVIPNVKNIHSDGKSPMAQNRKYINGAPVYV